MFLVPFVLFADLGQNGISHAPDGSELKWEEGAWDFFIMHKTLIDHVTGQANLDQYGADNTAQNPQGDTFIDQSTYTLTSKHIPPDAFVDRAFLAWLSTLDPTNPSAPTDNSVTLTFKNAKDPEITFTKEVTASIQGSAATTTIGNFEFEALAMPTAQNGAEYLYTYRVEVSDFMKEIIKMGEAKGMKSGEALYGDYTVSGMEGSNHQNYLTGSSLVGGWFLPFVYTSANISAKKIYFYNGLAAYRDASQTITVSGFELPDEAIIKLGLVVFEGDPGLYSPLFTHMEGLAISSQGNPTDFAPLYNNCNPNNGSYTEMYNSISSIFGWEDSSNYWCSSDPNKLWPIDPANPLEYAIDADVLVVDASPAGPFYNRFVKGDTMLNLQIGANQDQVYTNLLIVSVDTKLPDFDIPNENEKNYCSCSTEPESICSDRPFYYTIKVQNHGQNVANNVKLQDVLPSQVKYVPGTTEIATKFDASGNGTDWTAVPDIGDGGFPYATAKEVATRLEHCDSNNSICPEDTTVWIRFVVEPKSDLSKNEVIRNSADISSADSESVYHSNSSIPLRLKLGSCPPVTDCKLPPKAQCGGVKVDGNDNYCSKDEDCKSGEKCQNNECVADVSGDLTNGATVSFDVGQNSPGKGDTSEIIVPNPSEKLVLGQFYLVSEGDEGKFYEFKKATFKINKDTDVEAKNFALYKDNNGDGKIDDGDTQIASSEGVKNSYVEFSITEMGNRLTKAGIKNHFIVAADVSATPTGSGMPGKFYMVIEGGESFTISDSGTVFVKGSKREFATFRFEPSEGFVFTKGQYDPQVPAYKDFNGKHEMLQVRTKSIGKDNKIKSIKIKTSGNYVKFGEGIKSISLILDNDKNGVESAGDKVVATVSSFDSLSSTTIDKLDELLIYGKDEEKYLIFKAEFKMSVSEKAKITVQTVKLESNDQATGVPVSSKEFIYECDPQDPNSCSSDDDSDGGCAVSALPESENGTIYVVLAVLASMLALAAARVFSSKK